MKSPLIYLGVAKERIQWQQDHLTGRRRPIQQCYFVEERGYKNPIVQTEGEFHNQIKVIADIIEGLNGCWITGACSISLHRGYDRTHTNLDLGLMRDHNLACEITRRFESKSYFLFGRLASYKPFFMPGTDRKNELQEPVEPEQLICDLRQNRNPQFIKIENNVPVVRNEPLGRINIYLYEKRGDDFYCLEDGRVFSIKEMVTTTVRLPNDRKVRVIKPEHMFKIKTEIVQSGSNKPKHLADLMKLS